MQVQILPTPFVAEACRTWPLGFASLSELRWDGGGAHSAAAPAEVAEHLSGRSDVMLIIPSIALIFDRTWPSYKRAQLLKRGNRISFRAINSHSNRADLVQIVVLAECRCGRWRRFRCCEIPLLALVVFCTPLWLRFSFLWCSVLGVNGVVAQNPPLNPLPRADQERAGGAGRYSIVASTVEGTLQQQ